MSSQKSSRVSRYHHLLLALPSSLMLVALKSVLWCSPSFAASEVTFRYGIFEESISVKNLRTYVETQKAAPDIKSFLSLIGSKNKKASQEFLQTKIPLKAVAVDKLLDTDIGKEILLQAAKVTVRRDDAGVQALRAALVLATSSPQGLGFISFLETYPSQRLTIDVTQLPKLISFLASNQDRIKSLGSSFR